MERMERVDAKKMIYPGISRADLVPARDVKVGTGVDVCVKGDTPFFATITEIRLMPRQPKNPVVVVGGCMYFGGGTRVKPHIKPQ